MRLLGAADVRRLADALDVAPTKRLGQNFVHDGNTVRRIVRLAEVAPDELVLEIGPGLGSLTLGLLEAGARVVAVELDRRLAEALPDTVADLAPAAAGSLTVVAGDALRVDVPGGAGAARGEPAVQRLGAGAAPAARGRAVHRHRGGDGAGRGGGAARRAARLEGLRLAEREGGLVRPVHDRRAPSAAACSGRCPNVDSVLVRFDRGPSRGDAAARDRVFRLVDAAFAQRRKTLRQALGAAVGGPAAADALLTAAGIDPSERGERLSVDDFVALAAAAEPVLP